MDMTKFSSLDDEGYKAVAAELRRWIKAVTREQARTQSNAQDWQEANSHRDDTGHPPPPGFDNDGYYEPHMGQPQMFLPPMHALRDEPQQAYPHPFPGYSNHQRPSNYSSSSYAPSQRYQQYRSEGGYVSPPPPPEPQFLEAIPPMPSPHPRSPYEEPEQSAYQCPQWNRRPSPRPDAARTQRTPEPRLQDGRPPLPPPSQPVYHQQGSHIIGGSTTTHAGGKTLQGMNVQVTGDWNFG